MKLWILRKLTLISVPALLCIVLVLPLVRANPDPLLVSWFIINGSGIPVDGAQLTIYYATSPSGAFTLVDPNIVEDKIANVFQNPVTTGYWNPEHPHGMAVVDIHLAAISSYYFYVKITFNSVIEYWPKADSIKPGDDTWDPVAASGSPSDYAASGNGLGNGPTTAYPNRTPPNNVVPEVPLGPSVAAASMAVGLVAYVGLRRRKTVGFP